MVLRHEFFRHIEVDDSPLLGENDAADDADTPVREMLFQVLLGAGTGLPEDVDLEGEILFWCVTHLLAHLEPTVLAVGMWEDMDVGCLPHQNQAVQLVVEEMSASTPGHGVNTANRTKRRQDLMSLVRQFLLVPFYEWVQTRVITGDDRVFLFGIHVYLPLVTIVG